MAADDDAQLLQLQMRGADEGGGWWVVTTDFPERVCVCDGQKRKKKREEEMRLRTDRVRRAYG